MTRQRTKQLAWKALGLCQTCGSEPALINPRTGDVSARCEGCRDRHRASQNAKYPAKVRYKGTVLGVATRSAPSKAVEDAPERLADWVGLGPEQFYAWAREKFAPATTERLSR